MTFEYLVNHITIQGNVKLTMWDVHGNVKYEDTVTDTEDLSIAPVHLWDAFEVKYMFAAPDGFLHIDFEWEDD